jgi:hypothetical protein
MEDEARLTFGYDYHQLFLYDASRPWRPDAGEYVDVVDAAQASGLTVATLDGVAGVLMPRQENFAAALELRVAPSEPERTADADHVVEFDLPLPSGRLTLEGSGGSGLVEAAVPAGRYRARLSGSGFDGAAAWRYGDAERPPDRYLLELWPSEVELPPAEPVRWPGHDAA